MPASLMRPSSTALPIVLSETEGGTFYYTTGVQTAPVVMVEDVHVAAMLISDLVPIVTRSLQRLGKEAMHGEHPHASPECITL